MNKPTLTVGIPAHNEAQNISHLVQSLLAQKLESVRLAKLVVVSDGSTDGTARLARQAGGSLVRVVENRKRMGLASVQNAIVAEAKSDYLAIVNADTCPVGASFLENLVKPLLADPQVGLTSGRQVPASPENFLERVLAWSHHVKKSVYERINNGHNIYNCCGVSRAFSRAMYRNMVWKPGVPEDSYSYVECLLSGRKFAYAPNAVIKFRAPSSLRDYVRQGSRYRGGNRMLQGEYGVDYVNGLFHIPARVAAPILLRSLLKDPIMFASYAALLVITKLFARKAYTAMWVTAQTTKKAIHA